MQYCGGKAEKVYCTGYEFYSLSRLRYPAEILQPETISLPTVNQQALGNMEMKHDGSTQGNELTC